jgi:hypothetical protein
VIEAWRVWRVALSGCPDRGTPVVPRVEGPFYRGQEWHPGDNVAACLLQVRAYPPVRFCSSAPGEEHPCGFWGLREAELLRFDDMSMIEQLRPGLGLVGTVGLHGRVREHEHGWRAERARPLAVTLVAFGGQVASDGGLCLWLVHRPGPEDTGRCSHVVDPAEVATVLRARGWPLVPATELGLACEFDGSWSVTTAKGGDRG